MQQDKAPMQRQGCSLDKGTLEGVRLRKPDALEAFFDQFYDRVHGYLQILLRNRDLAEDLTQDAFLRIHRGVDRLDPQRDPTGWVFTVVINTVRDYWRSREHKSATKRTTLDEPKDQPLPDSTPTADQALEQKDEARIIQRALAELSEQDREIILLRNYEELKVTAVAKMLDLKPEAVRQRHSRAVARLGAAFKKLKDKDRPER
jgi:RNA polymerase sigma-70 factor (ECF subfamily)